MGERQTLLSSGCPFLGLERRLRRGGPPPPSWLLRCHQVRPCAAVPGLLRNGGHGAVPRMCPGDTTEENTQGSAHVSGSCSDTLNFLAPSPVHTQPIRSCRQTVCPNSWFSKQSHDTLCLPGLSNWQTSPSAGLQTRPAFRFPLKGLTSTPPSCGMAVGSWWHEPWPWGP